MKDPDDAGRPEAVPERPQSPHPNYVTPAGLSQLEALAADLSVRRDRLLEAGKLADPQELATVQRDLRWVEGRLQRAIRVDPTAQAPDRVRFGMTVEVQDGSGRVERYSIVGEDEADAALGKISWVSPLAEALLHAEPGEEVVWRRPAGPKRLEVLTIHAGAVMN
ncbi:MAG: GreA/GreB family elongation factor [Holophagaceae bacterium]|uniref:GreA/GreB family elongation factor n=1 Tax=Candidatus Geothrix skivensis TaxID=2954439 RepID=A0A9D7XHV1_9BACT|nr:GreA/GreB family elongation factor [Candidatus Geothrix skivensis]